MRLTRNLSNLFESRTTAAIALLAFIAVGVFAWVRFDLSRDENITRSSNPELARGLDPFGRPEAEETAPPTVSGLLPAGGASGTNCTYTIQYWLEHADRWPVENLLIGERTYRKAEALAVLQSAAKDVDDELFQQFIAAVQNRANGAYSAEIERVFSEAGSWLQDNLGRGFPADGRYRARPRTG